MHMKGQFHLFCTFITPAGLAFWADMAYSFEMEEITGKQMVRTD